MPRRTSYQLGHRPVSVLQVKCTNTDLDGNNQCTSCGRWLRRRAPHNPNVTGSLGWTEHYADGSTYLIPPGESVSRPGS